MKIIDLFAGCGGLSLGFIMNGHEIVKAVEYDKSIANTYKLNHPDIEVIVDDIKNVDDSCYFKEGDADVIIGGPPCQGFSMAGARIRNGFIDDPRNYLFKHYFNIVRAVKPKAFVIENVKGILTMQKGAIFNEIISSFRDSNLMNGNTYNINYKVVNCVNFGIPQKRERVILVGTLDGYDFDFDSVWKDTLCELVEEIPSYLDRVSVYDAIGNLPNTSKEGIVSNIVPVSNYQKYLSSKNGTVFNHTSTAHSRKALERMEKIRPGENFTALNEEIKSVHSGSYGRLLWSEPAQTITTRFDTPAGGRFIHPVYNRTLSPREAARIQSFPDDFIFYGNKTTVCKQIGNAVPPKVSYFLSRLIENILKESEHHESTFTE